MLWVLKSEIAIYASKIFPQRKMWLLMIIRMMQNRFKTAILQSTTDTAFAEWEQLFFELWLSIEFNWTIFFC